MKRLIRRYIVMALLLANAAAVTGCGLSPETQRQIFVTCTQVVCDIYTQHAADNRRNAVHTERVK